MTALVRRPITPRRAWALGLGDVVTVGQPSPQPFLELENAEKGYPHGDDLGAVNEVDRARVEKASMNGA